MNTVPLRYNISSWSQLPSCLSNNSKDLRIRVTDLCNNNIISGTKISVIHLIYGDLFTCVINAKGDAVTDYKNPSKLHQFTTDQILGELEKYGFIVSYNPRKSIPGDQIAYLITLRDLEFDKLRLLAVKGKYGDVEGVKSFIVAFKSESHMYWLNNGYVCKLSEFSQALLDGTALNLTDVCITRKFNWDWLDYIANIDDVIRDNS